MLSVIAAEHTATERKSILSVRFFPFSETTPNPALMRQTIVAVLHQLDHGEAGDLLGEAFDVDQEGYADAVRDLTWCRNKLAEAIGLSPDTAIDLTDYDAQAIAERLAEKFAFLLKDIAGFIERMKWRQLYHALGDDIKALEQMARMMETMLVESDPGRPLRSEVALWRDGHAELARASSLLLRTVHDTLRHGLTLTARANLDCAGCRARGNQPGPSSTWSATRAPVASTATRCARWRTAGSGQV